MSEGSQDGQTIRCPGCGREVALDRCRDGETPHGAVTVCEACHSEVFHGG